MILTKNNFNWSEVWEMNPLERRAAFYIVIESEGTHEVNWKTGKLVKRETPNADIS